MNKDHLHFSEVFLTKKEMKALTKQVKGLKEKKVICSSNSPRRAHALLVPQEG